MHAYGITLTLMIGCCSFARSKLTKANINKLANFPTLASVSPKWNISVVAWARVICLILFYAQARKMHDTEGLTALMLVHIYQANLECPCYNYYLNYLSTVFNIAFIVINYLVLYEIISSC